MNVQHVSHDLNLCLKLCLKINIIRISSKYIIKKFRFVLKMYLVKTIFVNNSYNKILPLPMLLLKLDSCILDDTIYCIYHI